MSTLLTENKPIKEQQVISRERTVNFGEVLTARREVEAMLDLVKNEAERIDSRFLEPTCGTGNFLVAILERKLTIVVQRYKTKQVDDCPPKVDQDRTRGNDHITFSKRAA